MLRLSVAVPGPDKIFDVALANCGYDCEVSDKGRYQSETIRKFGGVEGAAYAVRHSQTSQAATRVPQQRGPTDAVYDEGVFLSDKRRYLNFACILKFLPDEAFARKIVDDYIAKGVFYRGLVLKCSRCSDLAWFSISRESRRTSHAEGAERISSTHTRAGAIRTSRRGSTSWTKWSIRCSYHNGDVTLLTLDALRRESKDSFQFAPELSIKPQGATKSTDGD